MAYARTLQEMECYEASNREAFAVLAERFRSIAKGLPVWNTIRQMGAAMDPDNPLYAL